MTDHEKLNTPVSPIKAGLGCKCPKCGKGKLYDGFLDLDKQCSVCGLDYANFDSGDGPAVFIILILGFFTVRMALFVEVTFQPPLWLHAIIWAPVIIGGSIGMLRPAKGMMIAMQYLYNAREGKLDK